MRAPSIAACLAAIVLASPGLAAARQMPAIDTAALFRNIQRQVLEYPHYTIFDTVSARIASDGMVTLTGKVTMPFKRDEIERRVGRVPGVRQVRNEIDVLPASQSDDDLRLAIARAIYNHQTFRPYAAWANPPIHVIVERGRVTLEGVVTDESERLLALSLAGSFASFRIIDGLKSQSQTALPAL